MSVAFRFSLAGVVVGGLLVFGVHDWLDAGAAGFAVALGVVGAIYLGTLIATPQPPSVVAQEGVAASLTFLSAALGLLVDPLWLVPGYLGHGVWDWMHHGGRFGARIADWYPPFCAAVDIVAGLAILALWWPA